MLTRRNEIINNENRGNDINVLKNGDIDHGIDAQHNPGWVKNKGCARLGKNYS